MFVSLIQARQLAGSGEKLLGAQSAILSPVWTAVLTLLSPLPINHLFFSRLLSGIGWLATAVLLTKYARLKSHTILALPAILLLTHPITFISLGFGTSWFSLIITANLLFISEKKGDPLIFGLPSLILLQYELWIFPLLILMMGWLGKQRKKLAFFIFAVSAMFLFSVLQTTHGTNIPFPAWGNAWKVILELWQTFTYTNELYWLYLPFMGVGFAASWRHSEFFFLMTTAVLSLFSNSVITTTAVFTLLAIILISNGVHWLSITLPNHFNIRANKTQLSWALSLLVLLPLLSAHASSHWHTFQARPLADQTAVQQIGGWLRENSDKGTAVFTTAAIGYEAERSLRLWDSQQSPDQQLNELIIDPPTYIVTDRTLYWEQFTQSGWFKERYKPLQQFDILYDVQSPYKLWQYQRSTFDDGVREIAGITAVNGLTLTSYQFAPKTIQPNDAVYVTLTWEATKPLTKTFNTIVRIVSPLDQVGWAQRDLHTPRSMAPEWIEAGDLFAERFVLTTTTGIPIGAYQLNFSIRDPQTGKLLTLISPDQTELDQIVLGHLAVPFTGEIENATPTAATFGDQISLSNYKIEGNLRAGGVINTTLYWEALRHPDANYTVFVHLLDESGQFVTSGDELPMNGRYITLGWQPGNIIPDEHTLFLPADLPAGNYQIAIGFYLLETGVRLPTFDTNNNPQPNDAFILDTIQIGN